MIVEIIMLISRFDFCPSSILTTVFLELPVSVVQWAHLAGLQPSRDAVEVEGVLDRDRQQATGQRRCSTNIADTPSYGALLAGRRSLVGLTLDAWLS